MMKFIHKHFYLLVCCAAVLLFFCVIPIDVEIARNLDGWKYNGQMQEDGGEPVVVTIQGVCTYRLFHTPRFRGTVAITGLGYEAAERIYVERGLSAYGFILQAFDGVESGEFWARVFCNDTVSKLALEVGDSGGTGPATIVVAAPASSRPEAKELYTSFLHKAGLAA